jgi:hypothetical protein
VRVAEIWTRDLPNVSIFPPPSAIRFRLCDLFQFTITFWNYELFEQSAQRKASTHTGQHSTERQRQTSMPWAWFEPTISATKRSRPTPQTTRPLGQSIFYMNYLEQLGLRRNRFPTKMKHNSIDLKPKLIKIITEESVLIPNKTQHFIVTKINW